jgi:hypothetical protein
VWLGRGARIEEDVLNPLTRDNDGTHCHDDDDDDSLSFRHITRMAPYP